MILFDWGDSMLRFCYVWLKTRIGILFDPHMSAFAAQTTFLLIISAFPFIMLLITLLGYIPGLEEQMLQSELIRLMPGLFKEVVDKLFTELDAGRNVTMISITAITTVYAASKGFHALIRGMNMVYGIKEQRRYIVVKGITVVCTFVMILAILLTLMLMVFGDNIITVLSYYLPDMVRTASWIMSYRVLLVYALLSVLFLLVYLIMPNRKSTIRNELPGALVAAAGWIGFTSIYSFFLSYTNTYIYGSLTMIVFIMLWLYFCIYLLFVGAQVNQYLRLRRLGVRPPSLESTRKKD